MLVTAVGHLRLAFVGRRQWMLDRRVVEVLEAHGAHLSIPRVSITGHGGHYDGWESEVA